MYDKKMLNQTDWGAQTEVKKDSAGNGAVLTLAAVKKQQLN